MPPPRASPPPWLRCGCAGGSGQAKTDFPYFQRARLRAEFSVCTQKAAATDNRTGKNGLPYFQRTRLRTEFSVCTATPGRICLPWGGYKKNIGLGCPLGVLLIKQRTQAPADFANRQRSAVLLYCGDRPGRLPNDTARTGLGVIHHHHSPFFPSRLI